MRLPVRWLPLIAALGLAVGGLPAAPAVPRPPNILILLADDLGYGELGCQGNPQIPTPHIDSLARQGVRFTQAYVTAPYCSPSRAGLLTGRYQTRFGYEFNPVGRQNLDPALGLPVTETTLASHLQAAGYRTGLVGKWHLGTDDAFHPLNRGFHEFAGFLHEGHFLVPPPYTGVHSFLRTNSLPDGAARWTNGPIVWGTHTRNNEPPYDADNPLWRGRSRWPETEYLTEAFTREAVSFIDRHHARPFLLYLAYNAVHSPMQATPRQLERFKDIPDLQRRIFAGMLSALDDSVGTLLARLRALGLEENTLIFFTSDNGGPTVELTSSNAPLRGGKGQLWEGGIRVPFLAQWKGRLPAGQVWPTPVSTLDIAATCLAAARHHPANAPPPDGVDLVPLLTGEKPVAAERVLFWRYGDNLAVREGDWKLVRQGGGAGTPGFQLFHLARDPAETRDELAAQPAVAARLRGRLEELNRQMQPPRWQPPVRPAPQPR